ncbi:MAG: SRPBCC domain-containing protein [Bacteroidetes bacterium]|nr:SRPBCC domain-containing protein [Bacteroidota bacterium]
MAEKSNNRQANDKDVLITHHINAKPETVFKAWTNPELLARWFAPDGCDVIIKDMDARKGGSFQYCIKNPKFYDCWCIGIYLEFIKPEKLVFSLEFADEQGNPAKPPVEKGMDPEWPEKTIVTVTFSKHEGGTRITLHQTVSEKIAKKTGAHPSWIQMLNRLNAEVTTSNNLFV